MPNLTQLKQLREDYKATFATENGKRVLADLEARCFEKKTTFSVNSQATSFNEGTRMVLVLIKNMMSMDVVKLQKELEKQSEEDAIKMPEYR